VCLLYIVAGGLYIAGAAALAWWLLEPINRVAGQLQFSTRFVLTDFLGLMVMIQAPLAVVGRAIDAAPGRDNTPYWLILSMAIFLVFILWAAAVSVVSRAGITRIWQRLCVIVLLVPGTLAIIVLWPLCVGLFIGALIMHYRGDSELGAGIAALPALVAAGLAIRWLSYWALKDSPGEAVLTALLSGKRPTPPIKMPAPSWPTDREL
jgi:hypothetical protein